MKTALEALLRQSLDALPDELVPRAARALDIAVESSRDARRGDFASNLALRLASSTHAHPRRLAGALVSALPANDSVARVEVAGAGFINFFLRGEAYHAQIRRALAEGEAYGRSSLGGGRRTLVEFVAASPTGPLRVAHGRQAAWGAAVANLLEAAGFAVQRGCYVNDAGRPLQILGLSTWLRYLERCGEVFSFPAGADCGRYLLDIARSLHAREGEALRVDAAELFRNLPPDLPGGGEAVYIDALMERARFLVGEARYERVLELARHAVLADIRADLKEFGVEFDCWFSARALNADGSVDQAIAKLQARGYAYAQDGALWFRSTQFGDQEDRLLVTGNGLKTGFAADVARLVNQLGRGFERLLYILGAEHQGCVPRLRAALAAQDVGRACLEARLVQSVTPFRGAEKFSPSTGAGESVTLRDLRRAVGNDAARLFYVMRNAHQPLDFDLQLARARAYDNPVYCIQYAHARIASVFKQLAARGVAHDREQGLRSLQQLNAPHESALLKRIAAFPALLEHCAQNRVPHTLAHYLRDLAREFHSCHNAHPILVENVAVRDARLVLAVATQIVLRNGLKLLGVSAPPTV